MSAFAYERDVESGTNTWLTPRWLLSFLGEFDLDPCAHPDWPIAKKHYCWPESDGLFLPWDGRVWCNPPYGQETDAWVERMAIHNHGTLLVFARTETVRFQRIWSTATALMFLYGRIAFIAADGREADSGNAPSVLVAFGDVDAAILHRAKDTGLRGSLVTRWSA